MSDGAQGLTPDQAKSRIRKALQSGSADVVSFSGHAFREMTRDKLETTDILNALRGGWVDPAEYENGEWRYRVQTRMLCVVISFPGEGRVRVVTAWRKRP